MRLTVGTHNLLDGAGTATPFADLLLFTEAPRADIVRRQLGPAYEVRSCPQQRDLLLAWRLLAGGIADIEQLGEYYHHVHDGVPEVTPSRGTWVNRLTIGGKRVKVPIAHRINAAFPPYKRGEGTFRARCWAAHTRTDNVIIRNAIDEGWDVIAGGDLNTPPGVDGYNPRLGLTESGHSLDRIATTGRVADVEILSNVGSDHPRLRVLVVL